MSAAEPYTTVRFDIESGIYRTYHVHFIPSQYPHYINFEVYPVSDWEGINGDRGTDYLSKESSDTIEGFDARYALLHFTGSMCWRGVWDSRIYFPDGNEYDGDDFAGFSELWSKYIEPWCKEYLRKKQPHLDMCDE